MVIASDIRVGNVIRVDGKLCKVLTQEIRGTGKFGKSAMLKLRSLEEGNVIEKKMSADANAEEVEVHVVKMQFSANVALIRLHPFVMHIDDLLVGFFVELSV